MLNAARRGIAWLCLLPLLLSCAAPALRGGAGQEDEARRAAELEAALLALGEGVDRAEARALAVAAHDASRRLAAAYRVAPPARWHNLLVQLGARERGLCYHWAEDLLRHLKPLGLRTLELHWGVAHRGSDLREHNSVVVTAAGRPFAEGLVLDPWREAGRLVWVRVREDRYPWEPLPPEAW